MATNTKKVLAKSSKAKDRTGMSYKMVREVIQPAPNVRKLVYFKLWEDGTKERERSKCFGSHTITLLKDQTHRIDGDTYLHKDGSVECRVSATARLERCDYDGKWHVCFSMDQTFSDLVEMLQNELAEHEDLSGTLEGANIGGPYYECAEGMAESEPLTDEQAAKIREYFTPDWLDAKPGEYPAN